MITWPLSPPVCVLSYCNTVVLYCSAKKARRKESRKIIRKERKEGRKEGRKEERKEGRTSFFSSYYSVSLVRSDVACVMWE
jgi:hypothetical protein